ncbi:MAG: rhodanese-like domain-containing protein [Alphaproteobacteria bacterium]|jgi:rhodanese-related sulfurtransferase|nr:rhodanese-like domain-containing protein [Alphaproteobacteria bacterium]MBT7942213.1 rhodanese-like domain-containing protein [Alphaproteobacteria bacterium]
MTLKKTVKQMVREAEAEIKAFPVLQAMDLLENDDHVFVDLRDVRELDTDGMVPNAFHAPRGMIEFWIDPESPYHKDIFAAEKTFVFYCKSGWRSALATKTVQDMGLENVAHIHGGFTAWVEAECPVAARPKTKKD